VEKLFFDKGLISGLILLEQGEKQKTIRKTVQSFLQKHFFGQKNCPPPRFLATIVNRPNNAGVQNNWHNSEPIH